MKSAAEQKLIPWSSSYVRSLQLYSPSLLMRAGRSAWRGVANRVLRVLRRAAGLADRG
jgi:hypothetical protein